MLQAFGRMRNIPFQRYSPQVKLLWLLDSPDAKFRARVNIMLIKYSHFNDLCPHLAENNFTQFKHHHQLL